MYHAAQGHPTMHYDSRFSNFFFCGYDNKKNLYVSAEPYGSHRYDADLLRLAPGHSSFDPSQRLDATLYGNSQFEPSVQWDDSDMTVTALASGSDRDAHPDHLPNTPVSVYRLHVSGSNGTVIGTTTVTAKKDHHLGQSWIQGGTFVGLYTREAEKVGLWAYPEGGTPQQTVVTDSRYLLQGVTVSVAP